MRLEIIHKDNTNAWIGVADTRDIIKVPIQYASEIVSRVNGHKKTIGTIHGFSNESSSNDVYMVGCRAEELEKLNFDIMLLAKDAIFTFDDAIGCFGRRDSIYQEAIDQLKDQLSKLQRTIKYGVSKNKAYMRFSYKECLIIKRALKKLIEHKREIGRPEDVPAEKQLVRDFKEAINGFPSTSNRFSSNTNAMITKQGSDIR